MRGNQSLILEGLANKDTDILEGVKADVRNKKEALMVIELLMKDFDISLKEVNSLFESVQESVKISLEQNKRSCALSNLSLKKGWGDNEIKNTISDCEATPESIASKLNAADWIVGKDWKKAAGSNDKKIRLKGTDTFGNSMFLTVQY